MRILMTTDTVGGVWTFTRQLTAELLERGHHVALVSFGRMPSPSQRAWCERTSASYRAAFRYTPSAVPLEWMQNNEGAYDAGGRLLRRVAREFSPDILLTSQYCFAALPLPMPAVVIAHSDVLSWASACGEAALPVNRWLSQYRRLVREGLSGANAVVAPTHWMLSALAANFPLPQIAEVIPNGRTLPPAPAGTHRKLQAVAAGRFWDEAKNLKLLLGMVPPLPVLVAGPVDHVAPSHPAFSSRVQLLGELTEDRVLALFRESAIYLCTSVYEPFGLAPLEAALCGCAVIANDIPSLREVWGDGALYFQNAASLTALLHGLHDPDRLALAQRRSMQRAQHFSASRMAEGYLHLFDLLLRRDVSTRRSSAHAA